MQIFVDSDGVVANWSKLSLEIFDGVSSEEYEAQHGDEAMWAELEAHENFFGSLELLDDGVTVYEAIKHLDPIFLSGVPKGDWAAPQKEGWFAENFPENTLITCRSRDKCKHMIAPGDILIDDFLKWKHLWEGAGGIFVHHVSAEDTIRQLVELGVDVRA